ncbi:ethanolamine ammonia-lyase [Escherichia coli]|nr:ethanolamine ammonia-lyase [Escherichia coli]
MDQNRLKKLAQRDGVNGTSGPAPSEQKVRHHQLCGTGDL